MEHRDIYNSVVSKVATLLPMFAKAMVDLALREQGVDKDSFTAVQLLDAIEKYIDPRLCQQLGEDCSVLTAGTGMIVMNDENAIVSIDPIISNMLNDNFNITKSGSEQFEQLHKLGILCKFTEIKHLNGCEKYIPEINRYLLITFIKANNNDNHQAMVIIQDVSVRKHIEKGIRGYSRQLEQTKQELKFAYENALAASNAKSAFLSHMSHELRTPLNAILGFAQILEMDGEEHLTAEQLHNVKDIIQAGDHLLGLISDVLDLAKIEKGKIDLSIEEISLSEIITSCLSLIGQSAQARHIEIINQTNNNDYIVRTDPKRLKQVLLNLLSNAVKYNRDNGNITLTSEIVGKQRIKVCIHDTGPGLDQEQLKSLFVPFERLHKSLHVEGAGIGLTITKQLIELMGGSIGVDSNVGEGSKFWFELNIIR